LPASVPLGRLGGVDYLAVECFEANGRVTAIIRDAPDSILVAEERNGQWRALSLEREGAEYDFAGFKFNPEILLLLDLASHRRAPLI
jgi:hypothetical protein